MLIPRIIRTLKVKGGEEWSTFTYEGLVNEELNSRQTITIIFARNTKKTDILYFDDISLKVRDGSTPIVFADDKVKEICVSNWDTNGDGELSLFEAASVTELGDAFMVQGITSFNEFQYFTGLTSLTEKAFYSCTQLTSIIIPSNVTEIGSDHTWAGAFGYCYNLTSVTMGDKVEVIGDDSFRGCALLPSITFPSRLRKIGDHAFMYLNIKKTTS